MQIRTADVRLCVCNFQALPRDYYIIQRGKPRGITIEHANKEKEGGANSVQFGRGHWTLFPCYGHSLAPTEIAAVDFQLGYCRSRLTTPRLWLVVLNKLYMKLATSLAEREFQNTKLARLPGIVKTFDMLSVAAEKLGKAFLVCFIVSW